ncbi:MAG: DUF2726 domain-containing protein [Gammaproteobacteria bacterium]
MDLFVINVVAIVFFLILGLAANALKKRGARLDYPYQYQLQALFTPAERSFYGVLKQAVGDQYDIFGKVRVADVLTPKRGMNRSEWQRAFNKISARHFDFVLCDKASLTVQVIGTDDSSHNKTNRIERDEFVNKAAEGIVWHYPVSGQSDYTIQAIQDTVLPHQQAAHNVTFLSLMFSQMRFPSLKWVSMPSTCQKP